MEMQQLEFVLAVMKTGSFTQAAKRCFTSRQNIAHAVKSAEREFGVELFWREGKNLKLTDDGKAFSEKAQAVINLLDDMHDIANENRRSLQPIGVVVSTTLLSALPADASGVFFDYPGGIRISESGYQDCVESVCAGLADGAFVIGMNRNFNMCDSLHIATIPVYAWTARSSSPATEKALKLEMLGGQRLILVSDDKLQYGSLMQSLQNSGIHNVRFSTITGAELAEKIVGADEGIGLVSEAFAQCVPEGTVAIPLDNSCPSWQVYALYQASAKSAQRFLALARNLKSRMSSPSLD